MCVFVCLYVEPASRSKENKCLKYKLVLSYACACSGRRGASSFVCKDIPLLESVSHACQVTFTVGDSSLCCCTCVFRAPLAYGICSDIKHNTRKRGMAVGVGWGGGGLYTELKNYQWQILLCEEWETR